MNDQIGVILVHNREDTLPYFKVALEEYGFRVFAFWSAPDCLDEWMNPSTDIRNATALIVHKDIYEAERQMPCADFIGILRQNGGAHIRTILTSGEYGYGENTREESLAMGADAGYDDQRRGEDGRPFLPRWVEEFILLGYVSEREANQWRGYRLVQDQQGVTVRSLYLDSRRRSKEF